MSSNGRTIIVNGRDYQAPKQPTVVICLDGSEPGYIEKAIEAGVAPTFARFMKDGAHVHASSVIPSFTNPYNLSIITGRPPSVHGIAGNYFYDPASGSKLPDRLRRLFSRVPAMEREEVNILRGLLNALQKVRKQ